jgi:hypothetical protein
MQTANRIIFQSTNALDGQWQDISLMTGFSLQVTNLEGHVWVEVSNDPSVKNDGATIAAPAGPTVSSVPATGFYANPGTYTAKVTLVTSGGGETTGSVASGSQVVAAGNTLQVASPVQDAGGFAVGYNVYVSTGGAYYLQNPNPIKIGVPFTLLQLQQATVIPSANTSGTPGVGVSLVGDLGAIVFPAPTAAAPSSTYGFSFGEAHIVADTGNGNQVFVSFSSLAFKYIRVRKSNAAQSKATTAYLMGQNG